MTPGTCRHLPKPCDSPLIRDLQRLDLVGNDVGRAGLRAVPRK
jgi:hypothetical protein